MDRVCNEVLQLIFFELNDPNPLTQVSKHFYSFSQDPYVRARYFLARYGPIEALYYAFARGRLMTERVIDILLASGAHMSRYLVQIAIHHYFYSHSHFIKGVWVRNVPLRVFSYFLTIAERRYGEIPRGKHDDDGNLFVAFLKESRLPSEMKSVNWETIRDILQTYKFMPLCNKDPIMSRLPLALAVEPRLLPYAVANGFYMDSKYRDFVFRKMFEKPLPFTETKPEEIAQNVRELCKLESSMFVTRTVASEVCMEAKSNESGYRALKLLDRTGHLRFELSTLVCDLIKTFFKTRSITNHTVIENLRYLHADMPSNDPRVRLVMILATFLSNDHSNVTSINQKLDTLGVTPITKSDIQEILMNPFVEQYNVIINYAKKMVEKEDGTKGLSEEDITKLLTDVACRCLELGSKGKFLDKVCQDRTELTCVLERYVLDHYQIVLDDLPSWENDPKAAASYEAKLSLDYVKFGVEDPYYSRSHDANTAMPKASVEGGDNYELGMITQESLTTMIRHDEAAPSRSRRRMDFPWGTLSDSAGKMHYPPHCLDVGNWIKKHLGAKNVAAAVFMTHAVINGNESLMHQFLTQTDLSVSYVPVTLEQFRILARLGKAPSFKLIRSIEMGAKFYRDMFDYLSIGEQTSKSRVKGDMVNVNPPSTSCSNASIRFPMKIKKRPRRSAATAVHSYVVPDSDEDTMLCDKAKEKTIVVSSQTAEQTKDIHLRQWMSSLNELLRSEKSKYNAKKRRLEKEAGPDVSVNLPKSEFIKIMSSNLRHLKKQHKLRPVALTEMHSTDEDDDDDYHYRAPRAKRRRTINA
ncbi:hypothetical protein APHAL10511_002689 [Amanita phalloides]|nr:hypothetical protein APHAL10511_002689 [Amanita phalloides]